MAADEGDAADRDAPATPKPDTSGDIAGETRPHPSPGGRHAAPEPEGEAAPEPGAEAHPGPDAEPEPPPETPPAPDAEHEAPPRPAPAPPVDAPTGSSRRAVLLGAAAVVLAAGGGVGAGFLARRRTAPVLPRPPAELVAAAATERRLIADLDATTGGSADVRQVIASARADHAAHLQALEALLGAFRRPVAPAASTTPARGVARTAAQLRAAETSAAVDAERRAAAATGSLATLLASISACESTHAALLT